MRAVRVLITKYVDDHQPGWVECKLTDAQGHEWSFVEKAPVVSLAELDGSSTYPQSGLIACQVISSGPDISGRETVEIDTERPWAVESVEGTTRFTVYADQLMEWQGAA